MYTYLIVYDILFNNNMFMAVMVGSPSPPLSASLDLISARSLPQATFILTPQPC